MKIKALIGSILLVILSLIVIFYFQSGGKKINANIPKNIASDKELISLIKPYIDEYFQTSDYYIGKIGMTLDENRKGQIEVWYKDKKKDKNGIPNIITVEVDTNINKIVRIVKQERNSKIEPGEINIDKWPIDSNKAIEIAMQGIKEDKNFKYTSAHLSGTNLYLGSKETWDVTLYNEDSKKAVYAKIDAYSGNIYSLEEK